MIGLRYLRKRSSFFQSATHWTTSYSPGRATGWTPTGTWSSRSSTSSAHPLATAPKIRTRVSSRMPPEVADMRVSRTLHRRIVLVHLCAMEGWGGQSVGCPFFVLLFDFDVSRSALNPSADVRPIYRESRRRLKWINQMEKEWVQSFSLPLPWRLIFLPFIWSWSSGLLLTGLRTCSNANGTEMLVDRAGKEHSAMSSTALFPLYLVNFIPRLSVSQTAHFPVPLSTLGEVIRLCSAGILNR